MLCNLLMKTAFMGLQITETSTNTKKTTVFLNWNIMMLQSNQTLLS